MLGPGRSVRRIRVLRREGAGDPRPRRDDVVVEEPMEIRLAWQGPDGRVPVPVAVTMRTPGDDFELAAGFLFGEGLLGSRSQVADLTYCTSGQLQTYNIVEVRLRPGVQVDVDRLDRNFYTSSSCGVCGKASLEAVEVRGCAALPLGEERLAPDLLAALPDRLREKQAAFRRTGGIHGAGLLRVSDGSFLVREDVGRHNAVDKVVGKSFLDGTLPLAGHVLVVSGRVSFEIVQKAVAAGIPAVVAVGAASSLAVDLASRFNLTLVGFVRDGTYNVYHGEERLA